jgi:hypothetical protein
MAVFAEVIVMFPGNMTIAVGNTVNLQGKGSIFFYPNCQ